MHDLRRFAGVATLLGLLAGSCMPLNDPPSYSSDRSPAWSPVADSIAYVHFVGTESDTLPNGIYVIGTDGGGRRPVRTEFVQSVDWSPDGRRLVYATPFGLFTCSAFGDSVETVVDGVAYHPSWSPAGDMIAYDDVSDAWTIPVSGGTPARLTTTLGGGRDPDGSPQGTAVVLVAPFLGATRGEVATIMSNSQLLSRVTNDSEVDRSPAWSPNGGRIAWNRWGGRSLRGEPRPEFWIADTSGAHARRLAIGEGSIAWSRDGTRLAYTKDTGAGGRLFTIGADGTGLRQITY